MARDGKCDEMHSDRTCKIKPAKREGEEWTQKSETLRAMDVYIISEIENVRWHLSQTLRENVSHVFPEIHVFDGIQKVRDEQLHLHP
jgi:predicted GTPase